MVDTKVWFLASGNKKVGPLSRSRVLERLSAGKVPHKALAWREGMSEWLPVTQVEELASATTLLLPSGEGALEDDSREGPLATKSDEGRVEAKKKSGEKAGAAAEPQPESKAERRAATRPTQRPRRLTRSTGAAAALEGAFRPPHRFERSDVWRAFSLGLEGRRVLLSFSAMLLGIVAGLVTAGVTGAAGAIHPLVGLPFALLSGLVGSAIGSLILGALAWQARKRLEGEDPSVREALRFALGRAAPIALPPLVLSIAWVAPLVALLVLSLLMKVPYVGPIGTGLIYGVHIALGATTLFLLLAATMGGAFGPVVAAFEETDVRGTLVRLLGFVRASAARVVLWSLLPGLAFVPFAGAVLLAGLLSLAIPLAFTALMVGPGTFGWIQSGGAGEPPYPGLVAGAIPMALWVVILGGVLLSILGSVQGAAVSILYAGGRPGNDELPSRDAVLARAA